MISRGQIRIGDETSPYVTVKSTTPGRELKDLVYALMRGTGDPVFAIVSERAIVALVRARDAAQLQAEQPTAQSLTDYWAEHYVEKNHCSLCGNTGQIDTTGVHTPAGVDVGRVNFCICPNGQAWRRAGAALPLRAPAGANR